ncbi:MULTISPECIES: threonine-phosphate decarboxylase CobD [Pseudomonas]|uniref:threonine-phosphate decarboxylase n=1 Tax=Pseudomonas donghuensis TaxID=1163398 RepID=A0AAP0SCH1_9PSED|nr:MULTISPECIES: threonine-phosphate decarboxylase CobD [Pseudomonas]MDF9894856.1 cobalamin biosynthetic protein CobC [Pseudomonas vranovensis]KDN97974.1 threonine-phosphate decarboxylase [Pseudomonas donghuensis]MBF4208423.1 threonine-phosphate decarboxylase [Pseudomonas donghuensis]MBS7597319.1 threonine-phosphate decarboxylase [Pseudomonas sp. RC2C2]MCP6692964.1 threonine-phosphate decarboxylase CobD [Pseudomonas donghuensis]
MLEHGGRLQRAVQQYGIAREDWLDLSSGIAPWPYPIPEIPLRAWARLPETDDGLERAACEYYQVEQLLPVAGSQAAIQALPRLRRPGTVGVLSPCYAEHAEGWRRAGHRVRELPEDQVDYYLDSLDVLVVVNPNNPSARLISAEQLLEWHARLARRGGWLLVDEAFMDNTPQHSIAAHAERSGLIVLRSFGKFFGLAGVRLGFVLAERHLLQLLAEQLGPWTISGPTRVLGQACLLDSVAHQQQIVRCAAASQRLAGVLSAAGFAPHGSCDLFQYLVTDQAAQLHEFMARRGILLRLFTQPPSLRFGLPASEQDFQRLALAFSEYRKEQP